METLQTVGNRTVEPIALDDPLVLDGEAERSADGKHLIKSQQGWEQHFADAGKRLPTVGEYVTALKQLDERKNTALPGILQDLRESALCTGTKIDYGHSNLPQGSGYLDELMKDSAWKNALQDEVLQYDAQEAVSVLQRASGKRPYLWTPDAGGRKSYPERAVWLGIYAGGFSLGCYDYPILSLGRARGVRDVGAASARAEKTGSAYCDSAKTSEEVLGERIREILSPYEQLKSSATAKLYGDITENAVRDFKELYKKP
ncbi:MAG: hypothetical protein Q8R47_03220 [Nanoarchaeota archaeon]|nr:hypothetical protein [Nanoarchaeota archaeon]